MPISAHQQTHMIHPCWIDFNTIDREGGRVISVSTHYHPPSSVNVLLPDLVHRHGNSTIIIETQGNIDNTVQALQVFEQVILNN